MFSKKLKYESCQAKKRMGTLRKNKYKHEMAKQDLPVESEICGSESISHTYIANISSIQTHVNIVIYMQVQCKFKRNEWKH